MPIKFLSTAQLEAEALAILEADEIDWAAYHAIEKKIVRLTAWKTSVATVGATLGVIWLGKKFLTIEEDSDLDEIEEL